MCLIASTIITTCKLNFCRFVNLLKFYAYIKLTYEETIEIKSYLYSSDLVLAQPKAF